MSTFQYLYMKGYIISIGIIFYSIHFQRGVPNITRIPIIYVKYYTNAKQLNNLCRMNFLKSAFMNVLYNRNE